jgi:hypothetical protein
MPSRKWRSSLSFLATPEMVQTNWDEWCTICASGSWSRIFRATQNRAGCRLDAQEDWSFRVLLSHDDAARPRQEQLRIQFVEQCLGGFQVGVSKPSGESVVDFGERRACLVYCAV